MQQNFEKRDMFKGKHFHGARGMTIVWNHTYSLISICMVGFLRQKCNIKLIDEFHVIFKQVRGWKCYCNVSQNITILPTDCCSGT